MTESIYACNSMVVARPPKEESPVRYGVEEAMCCSRGDLGEESVEKQLS